MKREWVRKNQYISQLFSMLSAAHLSDIKIYYRVKVIQQAKNPVIAPITGFLRSFLLLADTFIDNLIN